MSNLTDSDESMLDEIFGADEDSGGIDLPAFAPARLQEAETLRASLNLETLRPAGVSTLRELLAAVMHQTRGNQSKAAIVLGLNRGTLRTKLKQYGLL
jgi:DNA-binding NtrC family response regulator